MEKIGKAGGKINEGRSEVEGDNKPPLTSCCVIKVEKELNMWRKFMVLEPFCLRGGCGDVYSTDKGTAAPVPIK